MPSLVISTPFYSPYNFTSPLHVLLFEVPKRKDCLLGNGLKSGPIKCREAKLRCGVVGRQNDNGELWELG